VPEAAVNKYGYFSPWPCEVGLARDAPMLTVTAQAGSAKQLCERKFGRGVSSGTNRGHDLRTNFFADVIHDNSVYAVCQRDE
jgi:hypothetical protein